MLWLGISERLSPMRQKQKTQTTMNKQLSENEEIGSTKNNEDTILNGWHKWGPSLALITDLLFLRSTSRTLVLSVGSFSFWCGWLGNATQVHIPIAGRQQQYILYSERSRFVYHDLRWYRSSMISFSLFFFSFFNLHQLCGGLCRQNHFSCLPNFICMYIYIEGVWQECLC